VTAAIDARHGIALPREACEHLYRIAQEALANAIKHSGAMAIEVALDVQADSVRLVVVDNGRGARAGENARPGLGLAAMRDRAEAIGGRLTIEPRRDGPGTAVVCEVQVVQLSDRLMSG
jgi:signal transduction histidine kinase